MAAIVRCWTISRRPLDTPAAIKYPINRSNSRSNPLDKAKTTEVRPPRPEDLDRILAIEKAAHRLGGAVPDRGLTKSALMKLVEEEQTRLAVATADGEVVGFLLFERDREAGTGKVLRLSVDPRRKGYGSALLRKAEALAAKGGCDTLVAEVYEEDLAAQKFFAARGFKGTPVKKASEFDGPCVRFSKKVG